MNNDRTQAHFFFGLLAASVVLTVLVFLPYLTALILALVCAVLFKPLHNLFVKWFGGGNPNSSFAAILTIVVVLVAVFTPISLLALKISAEARDLYVYLTDEGHRAEIIRTMNTFAEFVSLKVFGHQTIFPPEALDITLYVRHALQWSFTNIDAVFGKAASVFLNAFILIFALYYMLRDGSRVRQQIMVISPLLDVYDERIIFKLRNAIKSVVQGTLVVALCQGIMTGLGFVIFDIPNPALWGSLAGVASLIPGVGTALVLVPGVIFLIIQGNIAFAGGLLAWGIFAVGLIDNFLGPYVMNRGTHVHEFLILLSVLGGLAFFGPIGLILGPILICFTFTLLEIYKDARMKQSAPQQVQ